MNNCVKLYVVATPIGNLEDISARALRVLEEVDLILCEDTRRTQKLLHHYGINTKRESYHQHSRLPKKQKILKLLSQGHDLALVSDAGAPGISDPGGKLIDFLLPRLPELEVIPVPGASAITTLASVSALSMDSFLFLGYPPKKKKRNEFFEKITQSESPVVFFEAPYRIVRTLKDLRKTAGNKKIVVGRELTKKFEKIYRGSVDEILKKLQDKNIKGEFTIIVAPN